MHIAAVAAAALGVLRLAGAHVGMTISQLVVLRTSAEEKRHCAPLWAKDITASELSAE